MYDLCLSKLNKSVSMPVGVREEQELSHRQDGFGWKHEISCLFFVFLSNSSQFVAKRKIFPTRQQTCNIDTSLSVKKIF